MLQGGNTFLNTEIILITETLSW